MAFAVSYVLNPSLAAAENGSSVNEQYNLVLQRDRLDLTNGDEIQVREAVFPPGWKAPRHYHNSDLFTYVVSGEFEVDMDGSGKQTYRGGQALRMKPNTAMDARNASDEVPLKLAVFQVGNPDSPFVVPVKGD